MAPFSILKNKLRELGYSEAVIEDATRKGVFPYDYIDSIEKLNETELPPKEAFFDKLNNNTFPMTIINLLKTSFKRLNVKILRTTCPFTYGLTYFYLQRSSKLFAMASIKVTN